MRIILRLFSRTDALRRQSLSAFGVYLGVKPRFFNVGADEREKLSE